jgi:hypothetical protein
MRKDVRKKFIVNKKCEYEDCEQTADYVVECRFDGDTDYVLRLLCSDHANYANESAEYSVSCPNCNCHFGVG